jgi:hypothetical protein
MGRHIRQRGGQPGNQNARKHGFYSANLSPADLHGCLSALNNGGDLELTVLRLKLVFILEHAPGNQRLMRELTALLYKWFRSRYTLDRENKDTVRQFIRSFKDSVKAKINGQPEPSEAKS